MFFNALNQNNMKQTAVEWLIQEWPILEAQLPQWLIEQAKAMEKEQSEKMYFQFFKAGQESMEEGGKGFDQYYNENFRIR